jgi:hypothetical protein
VTVKISLRLSGIDLRHPAAYEQIGPELGDLFFEANGGVSLATVYTDEVDPTWVAADASRRVVKFLDGVVVVGVHDELVSLADIAGRCGVAAESVRLWAAGKRRASLRPFPSPRQVVGSAAGGKYMSLYAWRDVVSWVREVIEIDPDEGVTYLDDVALARLNAELVDSGQWAVVDTQVRSVSVNSTWDTDRLLHARFTNLSFGDAAKQFCTYSTAFLVENAAQSSARKVPRAAKVRVR